MPVNLNQYRATVGVFNNRKRAHCSSYYTEYNQSFRIFDSFILFSVIVLCLLYLFKFSGDVEENPGPKSSSNQSFFICHWNLNSVSTITTSNYHFSGLLYLLINLM